MKEPNVTVVSTARNAEKYVEACVRSVQEQDTEKLVEHIYIDASDGFETAEVLARMQLGGGFIYSSKQGSPCTQNLYYTIHQLPDEEVVIWLDGDDRLAGPSVVRRVLREYEDPNCWMTYGQFATERKDGLPNGPWHDLGWAAPYPPSVVREGSFRKNGFRATHLKTFRAGLFKQINMSDLFNRPPIGERYDWMQHAIDLAIMYPMLEMAGERHRFIPDVLCLYTNDNPASDHNSGKREIQLAEARRIEAMNPYRRLDARPW